MFRLAEVNGHQILLTALLVPIDPCCFRGSYTVVMEAFLGRGVEWEGHRRLCRYDVRRNRIYAVALHGWLLGMPVLSKTMRLVPFWRRRPVVAYDKSADDQRGKKVVCLRTSRPPLRLTIWRTIARPRPVPLPLEIPTFVCL